MDIQLNKKTTLLLTVIIIVCTVISLLQTSHFSVGLVILSCIYIILVLLRDYMMKLDLARMTGTLFLCLQLALAFALNVWSGNIFSQSYFLILVGEFAFHHSKDRAFIFTIICFAGSVLSTLIALQFPPFEQLYYLLPRAIFYYAIYQVGLLAKISYQQKKRLDIDNERLRIASVELEQKAKLEERTRISREIHDSVGHALTSALTGLQTASHALKKQQYSTATEMINRTNETISKGLNDVRTSVHLLRDNISDQPFICELFDFINQTMQQTNVKITHEMDPTIPDLPPLTELTIYRALQEGITNGIRHGESKQFRFSLTQQAGLIRFNLSDNGKSPKQIVQGFGLKAMKERVEDVGGELSITTEGSNRGVTLEITIPIHSTNEQTRCAN